MIYLLNNDITTDGTIRKQKRRLAGINYPETWKSAKKTNTISAAAALEVIASSDEEDEERVQNVKDILLEEISDDEWSSDDNDQA